MRLQRTLIATILMIAATLPASAATSYVAPLGAKLSAKADGSKARPWASVNMAIGKAKAGDTILLMDGRHAAIDVNNRMFTTPVTIRSETGKNASIAGASFGATTKNITLSNLKVWRSEGDGAGYLIRSYKGSTNLTLQNLDIRSRADATNYLNWKQSRWLAVASNAVDLRGTHAVVRGNTVTGVGRGIIAGPNSLVENNVIDGFAWDGMRGGTGTTFRNNVIKNSFNVDATHRDGIQSYSSSGVTGLTIDGNVILEWTHKTSSPLRGNLQGISLFDGYYDNLLIQNNTVATTHANGIVVVGTRNAKILGNTVVQIDGEPGKFPWIRVTDTTKDGRPSSNVLVSGNSAMNFLGGNAKYGIVFSKNSVIADPAKVLQTLIAKGYLPASVKPSAVMSKMVLLALGTSDNFFLRTIPASASAPLAGGGASLEPSPVPLPAPLIPLLSALGLLGGLAGFQKLKTVERAA
jgi:hypothetical protein